MTPWLSYFSHPKQYKACQVIKSRTGSVKDANIAAICPAEEQCFDAVYTENKRDTN